MILTPEAVLQMARNDVCLRSRLRNADVRDLMDAMSRDHLVITAYGIGPWRQPQTPLQWIPVPAGGGIPAVRLLGRAGGQAGCPSVKMAAKVSPEYVTFVREMDAVFHMG